MLYKNDKIKGEFNQVLRPKAQVLAYALDAYMQLQFGVHLIITSIYRENSKQHRGGFTFDFRDNLTPEQGDQMLKYMNDQFHYLGVHDIIADERKNTRNLPEWTAPCFHAQINWRVLTPWA